MASPAQFFFEADLVQGTTVQLDEVNARHVVQVLRRQEGDPVRLCNGRGYLANTVITETGKKKCAVRIDSVEFFEEPVTALHLSVAFTKNTGRNEWLLEKATELGVKSIIPLQTTRSEKDHIRYDRSKSILVSAMLQSQGYYLPDLHQPTALKNITEHFASVEQKLLAHCIDGKPRIPLHKALGPGKSTIVLIGPEGDFTEEEVALCGEQGFKGISMGTSRLRTETAAMAACVYFNMINDAE
jgi:16S rRNA (uracil1498-N3)-methyltransferase